MTTFAPAMSGNNTTSSYKLWNFRNRSSSPQTSMPPRLPRTATGSSNFVLPARGVKFCPSCSICRLSTTSKRKPLPKSSRTQCVRKYSDSVANASYTSRNIPKTTTVDSELHNSLSELQKQAGSYLDISRLQLALRGIEQGAGKEVIRIAVLGSPRADVVKELLRVILADPLAAEQQWEEILMADTRQAILLRLGEDNGHIGSNNALVKEIFVASPTMKGHSVELLLLNTDLVTLQEDDGTGILVPTIEIPMSTTGRHTPITTPVHKAIVVGSELSDIGAIQNLPSHYDKSILASAVHLPNYSVDASLPFYTIDVNLASSALEVFRESVANSMIYEERWFRSNVPSVLEWIKSGTKDTEGKMKAPVRNLISSIIKETSEKIKSADAARMRAQEAGLVPTSTLDSLDSGLQSWAERAHTELRDQLDVAFTGHRWRKLSWWKLFWRVDDVSMLSTDILTQRFLPESEKEAIFLAGKIEQAGVFSQVADWNPNWAYKTIEPVKEKHVLGTEPPPPRLGDVMEQADLEVGRAIVLQPWPLQIPMTRSLLLLNSVPTLQALAQKLVLQTLSTSAFSSAFAGLIYVSSLTTTIYEAGAVAALGTVWGLKRMQKKWETARGYWEGEVREEGRKAVKDVEGALKEVLVRPAEIASSRESEEAEIAKLAVERVRKALEM